MIEQIEYKGYIFQYDTENPTRRFKGGSYKSPKMPDPVAPAPIPIQANEAGDFEAKEARKRSSYGKTFLTGNLTPKSTGKKTTLGA